MDFFEAYLCIYGHLGPYNYIWYKVYDVIDSPSSELGFAVHIFPVFSDDGCMVFQMYFCDQLNVKPWCSPEALWILQIWSKSAWTPVTWPVMGQNFSYESLWCHSHLSLWFLSGLCWPLAYCFCCALWHPIHRTQPLYWFFTRNLHWILWDSGEGSHCEAWLFTILVALSHLPSSSLVHQKHFSLCLIHL